MKKIRSILLFGSALLVLVYSCHKNTGSSLVDISGFPLKAGDSWTYQVFDSIHNVTDTAVFSITGSYTLNGGPVYHTTQTNISGVIVDSGLIIQSADSIIYQPAGNGLFSDLTLLFPLAQGSKWHTRFYGDSVYVIATNLNRSVLGSNYDSICNVGRIRSVPDLYINQSVYIAPGVGIIEESYYMMGWVPQHKTIRLISYSIH
jgi:hypothetical protein